jgi:hypothetical protein
MITIAGTPTPTNNFVVRLEKSGNNVLVKSQCNGGTDYYLLTPTEVGDKLKAQAAASIMDVSHYHVTAPYNKFFVE